MVKPLVKHSSTLNSGYLMLVYCTHSHHPCLHHRAAFPLQKKMTTHTNLLRVQINTSQIGLNCRDHSPINRCRCPAWSCGSGLTNKLTIDSPKTCKTTANNTICNPPQLFMDEFRVERTLLTWIFRQGRRHVNETSHLSCFKRWRASQDKIWASCLANRARLLTEAVNCQL